MLLFFQLHRNSVGCHPEYWDMKVVVKVMGVPGVSEETLEVGIFLLIHPNTTLKL